MILGEMVTQNWGIRYAAIHSSVTSEVVERAERVRNLDSDGCLTNTRTYNFFFYNYFNKHKTEDLRLKET